MLESFNLAGKVLSLLFQACRLSIEKILSVELSLELSDDKL
jgi:hypothetical protein